MDAKISKHTKDIIQKYANALFKDTSLEFYGIKTAKIKELINVELPVVEVAESSMDFVLLLEDNTYLNIEFQSSNNKLDLERFASYNLRLYQRDKRKIRTVIIYPANIKNVGATTLDMGDLIYNPYTIMMKDYDGNKIFNELEKKLADNQELTDMDMMNLIFLPLMKHNLSQEDLAIKSIELAKTITDSQKRNACVASVFAFASKYLEEKNINNLLGVIKMTDLATLLVEQAVEEKAIEIAKNALKENLPFDIIKRLTNLDESILADLKKELNNQ